MPIQRDLAARAGVSRGAAQDWGGAPDTTGFVGRAEELALRQRWVLQLPYQLDSKVQLCISARKAQDSAFETSSSRSYRGEKASRRGRARTFKAFPRELARYASKVLTDHLARGRVSRRLTDAVGDHVLIGETRQLEWLHRVRQGGHLVCAPGQPVHDRYTIVSQHNSVA